MSYISLDRFEKHLMYQNTDDITVLASPFVSFISDHKNYGYKTLRSEDSFITKEKYNNIIIDIVEGKVYPKSKISHAYRWFIHSISLLKNKGNLKVRVPSYIIPKLSSIASAGTGFINREEAKNINIHSIYIDGEYGILDLTKEKSKGITKVEYNTGECFDISSNKLVVLKRYVKSHYDYLSNVDESTSFEYQATNGQRGYEIGQTFKQQFKHFCADRWNKNCIVVKANNGPVVRIETYSEVNDTPTSRDVFYLKNKHNVKIMRDKFQNVNFIDFVNNLSYDNFGSICTMYKKLLFNEKILTTEF